MSRLYTLILWCDNIGATSVTSNPLFPAPTKHIEIDFYYVCDQVLRCQLNVLLISTKDQYADALTKPLSSPHFHLLCNIWGSIPYPFDRGGM